MKVDYLTIFSVIFSVDTQIHRLANENADSLSIVSVSCLPLSPFEGGRMAPPPPTTHNSKLQVRAQNKQRSEKLLQFSLS